MVFDGIITFIVNVFDVIIDLIPDSGINALLEQIDFTQYRDIFAYVLYFIPSDVITFFIAFCLPVITFCLVVGVVRLLMEVIPIV